MRYSKNIIEKAIEYRLKGKMYPEISKLLGIKVPKATMSFWFRNLTLSKDNQVKLNNSIARKLVHARLRSVVVRNANRLIYKKSLNSKNGLVAETIFNPQTAKVALAMLCLGEASKYGSSAGFYLGNSDFRIIVLFIKLLGLCYNTDNKKFRFTVQCRADQNTKELENYWRKVVGVAGSKFYKSRIDPRTVGKPTLDKKYKGVLRVDYLDKKVQLDLESLADMIYNQLS